VVSLMEVGRGVSFLVGLGLRMSCTYAYRTVVAWCPKREDSCAQHHV